MSKKAKRLKEALIMLEDLNIAVQQMKDKKQGKAKKLTKMFHSIAIIEHELSFEKGLSRKDLGEVYKFHYGIMEYYWKFNIEARSENEPKIKIKGRVEKDEFVFKRIKAADWLDEKLDIKPQGCEGFPCKVCGSTSEICVKKTLEMSEDEKCCGKLKGDCSLCLSSPVSVELKEENFEHHRFQFYNGELNLLPPNADILRGINELGLTYNQEFIVRMQSELNHLIGCSENDGEVLEKISNSFFTRLNNHLKEYNGEQGKSN